MTLEEPNPINKKCGLCNQYKLLSEFDYSQTANDRRALFCKECESERRETDDNCCCSGGDHGHTNDCIIIKTLHTTTHELDCLLARVQNGLPLTPKIRAIMNEIIRQDEINQGLSD